MSSSNRSNPLALAVLGCLYERPMHPYEVAQTLRHRAKHESIRLNYGSLYSVVESLEKRGLIRAMETVREGRRPERTIYEITGTGSREFVEWLTSLIDTPAKEYLQVEAALSRLPGLPPDEAASALKERLGRLELQLTLMRAARVGMLDAGLPRLFALESEYMEALCHAELDYVRGLIKDIEGGSLDGIEMWRAWFECHSAPIHNPIEPAPG